MNHGEIVQIGTPTDIYEYPGSRFVADFIGSVNLFEGRIVEDEPDYVRVASDELGGTLPRRPRRQRRARRDRLGGAAAGEDPAHRASARRATATTASRAWSRKSPTAATSRSYLVKLASGRQMRVTQPNTKRQGTGDRIRWDDRVWLSWDSSSPVVVTQ